MGRRRSAGEAIGIQELAFLLGGLAPQRRAAVREAAEALDRVLVAHRPMRCALPLVMPIVKQDCAAIAVG